MRILLLFFLFTLSGLVHAQRAQPCADFPALAELRASHPAYLLENELTRPAMRKSNLPISAARFLRDGFNLICIALAVDETGTVKEATLYMPKARSLLAQERKSLLSMRFVPAELNGEAHASMVVYAMDFR